MDFQGKVRDHGAMREQGTAHARPITMEHDDAMAKEPPKLNKNKMSPEQFGTTFGIAVWLMTMDKAYADTPVKELEAKILAAILLQQFKLYSKEGQPVAFLTWAAVSDEIKGKIENEAYELELADWRSGNNIIVLECVSPFAERKLFEEEFVKNKKELG